MSGAGITPSRECNGCGVDDGESELTNLSRTAYMSGKKRII